MKKGTKATAVDCIALKRRAQARTYARTKGLTNAGLVDYYREQVARGPFADFVKKLSRPGNGRKKRLAV